MKAAKTWCLAGLVLVAGLASASCGKDEGTNGGGGNGSVIGGKGGTGGQTGRGGSSGTMNNAGGQIQEPSAKLGRACTTERDCDDPAAPDLTCITAEDTVLGNGAPPKGLCTAPCIVPTMAGDEDTCEALGTGALCYPFDSSSDEGYCLEGCFFGPPDLGQTKCHNRPEFACNPALLGATDTACTDTGDCQVGELCIDGMCDVVFPACLPSCRGDIDCAPGMYCDQGFLNGVCVTAKQTGKGVGEPCTLPAEGEPTEPDECLGFCDADSDTGNQGHCSATCGLARQCGWNATTEKFDGVCFYASALTSENGAVGDFGFCTPSCNCTDECDNPDLACLLLSQGALTDDFRGPGLCFAPEPTDEEYNQCDSGTGGAGGAGGAGSTDTAGAANGGDGTGGGN